MWRLEWQKNKAYGPCPVLRPGVYSPGIPVQLGVKIFLKENRLNRRCGIAWFRLEGELIHGKLTSYGCITPVDV